MAEFDKNKKKKFHNIKDKEGFRRTTILTKNDKDLSKDRDKQRPHKSIPVVVEKEKQPMILIKPREVTVIKESSDRPQSPKKIIAKENEIETQIIRPTKIAQNEHKEIKPPEPKFLAPHPTMPKAIKLIDENYEFCTSALEYLQDSDSNFLVVGVIGSQGVGKSTILNILAQNYDVSDLKHNILDSHNRKIKTTNPTDKEHYLETSMKSLNIDNSSKLHNSESLVFDCQTIDQIERGLPCTSGVDMYITKSRVILLDIAAVEGHGISKASGPRSINTGSGLEISAFLLAVCHVVILVQDWFTDVNLLRFIQSAEMVKPIVQASTNPQQTAHLIVNSLTGTIESPESQFSGEHHPHLLFLQNKCVMDDFSPESVQFMQDVYRKVFQKSKLQTESGLFMYDLRSNDSSYSLDGLFHNLNKERCGEPLNLFLMPMFDEDNNTYRGYPTIEELARKLKHQVFGASKGHLTNVQLTERTWLHYCNKTWENVKKSTFFIEYSRLLPQ